MKAILTLLFILLFGAYALAQNAKKDDTVEYLEMGVVLASGLPASNTHLEIKTAKEKNVARLYKFKNSRVKKALSFSTQKTSAKLA